jgi:hypothetical protein
LRGVGKRLRRRLVRALGRSPAGRIELAAAFRALEVLARRHPMALLDATGAAAAQAARQGIEELGRARRPAGRAAAPLTPEEWRRFRRGLRRAAEAEAGRAQ